MKQFHSYCMFRNEIGLSRTCLLLVSLFDGVRAFRSDYALLYASRQRYCYPLGCLHRTDDTSMVHSHSQMIVPNDFTINGAQRDVHRLHSRSCTLARTFPKRCSAMDTSITSICLIHAQAIRRSPFRARFNFVPCSCSRCTCTCNVWIEKQRGPGRSFASTHAALTRAIISQLLCLHAKEQHEYHDNGQRRSPPLHALR
jgi:hypothetical protein